MNHENYDCDKEIVKQLIRLCENIRKLRDSGFTLDLSGKYDKNKYNINNTNSVTEEQILSINLLEEVGEKNI